MKRWLTVLKAWLGPWYCHWVRFKSGTRVAKKGAGHLVVWKGAQLHGCRIEFEGQGHLLEIGPGSRLWGVHIQLAGEALHCRIGPFARLHGGHLCLTDIGSRIEIGARATMFDPMIVAQEGGTIEVGADCMFAYGTDIRCSDGHSILDAGRGERTNTHANVKIADHVWIGLRSVILKGVSIGSHAIVASQSVVTKSVLANTLVAGNPARLIRGNVTWDAARTLAPNLDTGYLET